MRDVCELIREKRVQEIIKQIEEESREKQREIAIAICNGKIVKEIGDRDSVKIPTCPISSPTVVIHTHSVSPHFSVSDIRVSHKYPVCMVYQGNIQCIYKGEILCQNCPLNK